LTYRDPRPLSCDDLALTGAFLLARAATLGALFIGEVLGQMPCTLCWYQRIAMFPLVPVLGLSLWRGDGMARAYALPLVLAGLALAAWHSGLYAGLLPAPIVHCTENGPSCTGEAQMDVAWEIAGAAGLDLERAENDRLFPGITGILNQDAADVEALAIRQTPTFFLNGRRLENFSADSLIADVRFAVENS
jgi:disulfide bond formation protein DsbB